jgi:addiction module RelB/DinJ family antitoxin
MAAPANPVSQPPRPPVGTGAIGSGSFEPGLSGGVPEVLNSIVLVSLGIKIMLYFVLLCVMIGMYCNTSLRGEIYDMGTVTFSIRMDEDVKNDLDAFCNAVGMNVTTLFNVCARTIVNEKRIPFEITTANDPFYGSSRDTCKNRT